VSFVTFVVNALVLVAAETEIAVHEIHEIHEKVPQGQVSGGDEWLHTDSLS
jgi:hypothetical protein